MKRREPPSWMSSTCGSALVPLLINLGVVWVPSCQPTVMSRQECVMRFAETQLPAASTQIPPPAEYVCMPPQSWLSQSFVHGERRPLRSECQIAPSEARRAKSLSVPLERR
ncbi:hypothetical protein D3C72_1774510 [compost metagenome]